MKKTIKELKNIIKLINNAHYIERWSELPRSIKFTILDRESLKLMISFILNSFLIKKEIDLYKLIQISIASFYRKSILTDIKNSIYDEIKKYNINLEEYIYKNIKKLIDDKEIIPVQTSASSCRLIALLSYFKKLTNRIK